MFISGPACLACDSSCQTCSTQSATSCTSCYSGTYLLPSNDSCVSCNVAGYYPNTTTQQCTSCDSSCQTCNSSNATSCLSCKTGTYLLPSNNSCVACTVAGYYQDATSQQCLACSSSCKTCSGPTSSDCLSCNSTYNLLNGTCYQCDSSCKTCSGPSSTDCLSCPSGTVLNQENSCVVQSEESSSTSAASISENYTLPTSLSQEEMFTIAALKLQEAATGLLPIFVQGTATTAVLFATFLSDVLLYRFINVPFPDNFIAFSKNLNNSLIPNIYASYSQTNDVLNCSTGKFAELEVSSVILENSGSLLNRELFSLCIIFLSIAAVVIFKRFKRAQSLFKKIRDTFTWNVFLAFLVSDFGPLFLFSMVQLRENKSDSWYAWYGFSLCLCFLVSYPDSNRILYVSAQS